MSSEAAILKGSPSAFWPMITIIFMGSFVGMYHVVSLNVSLPGFMDIFHTNLQGVQWITTGFMLTCGITAPLAGYLMQRFGVKSTFIVTLVGITMTSLLCSIAWNIGSLIAFRALQGLFCGLIAPITLAMVYQFIPEEKQVLALSIWSFSTIFSTSIGPTLSGWLQSYNWHLIFLTTLPIGVIVIIIAGIVLSEDRGDVSISFDWIGLLLASIASLSLLLLFGNMSEWGWSNLWSWLLLILGVCSSILFVVHELRDRQPLLHIRLLTKGLFVQSLLASLLLSFALYSGIYFVPLFLEQLRDMSSFEIGLVFLPASICLTFATFLSGKLYATLGAVKLLLIGTSILTISTFSLGYLTSTTSLLTVILILAFRNIGTGLSMTPITNVSMSSVSQELRGHASALVNWLRQLFSAIIIGVFTSFFSVRRSYYEAQLGQTLDAVEASWSTIYTLSHRDAFLLAGACLLLVFPLAFLLRRSMQNNQRINQPVNVKSS